MIRETSTEAYHKIEAQGLLSPKRWSIYKVLYSHGPLSYNEVFKRIQDVSYIASANIGARLNEMVKMRCVKETSERDCSVTGQFVLTYDVTKDLPIGLEKNLNPTRKELIEVLCQQVEEIFVRIKPETDKGRIWVNKTKAVLEQCQRHRKTKKRGSNETK